MQLQLRPGQLFGSCVDKHMAAAENEKRLDKGDSFSQVSVCACATVSVGRSEDS